MKFKYLIGLDEAGRGPLAGPVAMGAVVMSRSILATFVVLGSLTPKLKDSKKLSENEREIWFAKIKKAKTEGKLNFAVSLVSNQVIDKNGISFAVKLGIRRVMSRLHLDSESCRVLLDGGLKAPAEFVNQQTIIRGDETEPIIALASIVAKVTRDRYMIRIARKYPNYGFEINKGYGTARHRRTLVVRGPSFIHRRSFLKKILCYNFL